jgi:glycosyltransferase involved in cell wall biosynthesis
MISICIPAYKHVALTHEAAQSVLQQDADVELMILDDFYMLERTAENLRAIDSLESYLHADKRVKCISNESLLPIQDNWNKAVSLCTGRYIKLIGADDRMLPGSIEKMLRMINERPTIAFHGHLANIIDSEGVITRRQRPYGVGFINKAITGPVALKGKLRQQVRFKEPACNFYLKSAWETIGGYDAKYRFTFDIYFNIKMMSYSSSMLWNEYLIELRRHQASDGAQLPASLALTDLTSVVSAILDLLGDKATLLDKAAAKGWIEYRLIELAAQRVKQLPLEMGRLVINNIGLFASNPISLFWMTKLLFSQGVFGDVQQH